MGTTSEEIVRATGGPTVNEGLRSYFIARSAGTQANTLGELERLWLQTLVPGETGTNQDKWVEDLSISFNGTFNDMYNAFWASRSTP